MILIDTIRRHPVYAIIGALGAAVVASMTFTVVPETQQGLILSYGEIRAVVNPWKPNQQFGSTGAGLVARIPFIEQIQLIDKRVLGVALDDQPVLSTDQLSMQVDAYARFRITNPQRMYETIRNEDAVQSQLKSLLASTLRNELGKRTFATLLSPERGQVMDSIQQSLEREASRYGVQVLDVRINRADLPAESQASVFERMRSARRQAATAIVAEGRKQARLISAEAEGDAARIYAESFGKDPSFYAFYRAMKSYEATFISQDAGATTFVLPNGQGYLREFSGQ